LASSSRLAFKKKGIYNNSIKEIFKGNPKEKLKRNVLIFSKAYGHFPM
jgi:hypothetical protein